MSFYQIGKDLSLDDQWVLAHINAFLFPEDVQNAVWEGQLSIKHIRDLEPIIGANIEDATKIAREIILRRLTTRQAEELIRPRREEIEKARVDAAKKAIGAAAPIADVKLETPEEFERAAETLRKEARKRREETLTPKEKARIEAEKRRKEEERRKREEEAERKAREKLMSSREFLEQALRRAQVEKLREEYKAELKQTRLAPMVNVLNELTGDEWLRFTKSWYVFDALESDLEEERAVTIDVIEHPATFSPTMISEYVRFFTKISRILVSFGRVTPTRRT